MAIKTITKKTATASNSSFADRTAQTEADKNQWEQYNAAAKFFPGQIDKSLEAIATKTFPTDALNRKAYEEAILKSLTETLSPEVGLKDFWNAMSEAGCKELRIENGHMNFYGTKKERIDITPYTQPIVFEAHSSYYEQRNQERAERIVKAKQQLQDLLQEINQK